MPIVLSLNRFRDYKLKTILSVISNAEIWSVKTSLMTFQDHLPVNNCSSMKY